MLLKFLHQKQQDRKKFPLSIFFINLRADFKGKHMNFRNEAKLFY